MYVLDTNTVIYFFKEMGQVATNLLAHSPSEIAIPTIVIFELEVGIAKSTNPHKRRQQLHHLLSLVTIVPFDRAEAKSAAVLRAGLEEAGTPIGHYDTLIAATALASGATLVTHNLREFQRVPGLQTVDWL